jgi:acetylornithine deacetylase/succinyl-diaminopimelate desuccinylase family protein
MKNNNINFKGLIEKKEVFNLLGEMIKINSVNPLKDVSSTGEKELSFFISNYLNKIGIDNELYPVKNNRFNVIGFIKGQKNGKNLVLEAHMDTVGVENMKIDPFLPTIKSGKIYGRGACDDKGSLASMILAIKILREKSFPLKGNLYLAAVIDEEYNQTGVNHLLNQGIEFDACIVGEPTNLDIITAHQGSLRWDIVTKGKSAHSSEPDKGENAIYYMIEVINEVQKKIIPILRQKNHPLVGSPVLSINIIQGGNQSNIIPNKCSITLDRRMIPGENANEILKEIDMLINKLKHKNTLLKIEREEPFIKSPPMQVDRNEKIVEVLFECISDNILVKPKIKGARFGTDAAIFVDKGIPAVVFGPGNIEQAHSEDEWISVNQVISAAEIIAETVIKYQSD